MSGNVLLSLVAGLTAGGFLFTPPAHGRSSEVAAQPSNLVAQFRNGQTFVTFDEVSDPTVTYNVYRSTVPINSVAGLTPIAVLRAGSGRNKYTNTNFIITDVGTPLANGRGLLVWTPSEDGSYFYAVTTSQSSAVTLDVNATRSPLAETHAAVPGAVLLRAPYLFAGHGSYWVYEYFAWEDYASYEHDRWPYYGYRFNIVRQNTLAAGQLYPLTLILHSAGGTGYQEPASYINFFDGQGGNGLYITLRDNAWNGGTADPYTGTQYNYTYWYGPKRSNGLVTDWTERRALRYIALALGNSDLQVDPNRVYVTGASLGGGGAMHIAYHHPAVFAASAPSTGWPDPSVRGWGGDASEFMASNTEASVAWSNLMNQEWMVVNQVGRKPPIVYTFNKDDSLSSPEAFPSLFARSETRKAPYFAKWQNGNHTQFYLSLVGSLSFMRFKKNEAYPAFANASNSDALTVQEGQRNIKLDWSSSLHDLIAGTDDDAIVDTADLFGMTFTAPEADATADVTILNAHTFHPDAGEGVTWSNVRPNGQVIADGLVVADADGLVSIPMTITVTGSRLTLRRTGTHPTGVRPAAPRNLRIVP